MKKIEKIKHFFRTAFLNEKLGVVNRVLIVQFVAGASQVKWNKVTNNLFATTHEGDVRLWDPRVSTLYVDLLNWIARTFLSRCITAFLWLQHMKEMLDCGTQE